MLEFAFGRNGRKLNSALFMGAHCDDIEIGCGGAALRLAEEHPDAEIHWLVFSSDETRAEEARKSAEAFLAGTRCKSIRICEFRNAFFPFIGVELKEFFESLKSDLSPDVIFTHYSQDLHQDHRVISDLTWNTFRDHLILEYEIPKYDGGLGSPNLFCPLSDVQRRKKVDNIMQFFETQHSKSWFTKDTFLATLRLRGIESNAASGFAEGFYCRKAVI